MKTVEAKDPDLIVRTEGDAIDAALKQGVRDTLLRHKERNELVVIERNREILWVRAQDLLRD